MFGWLRSMKRGLMARTAVDYDMNQEGPVPVNDGKGEYGDVCKGNQVTSLLTQPLSSSQEDEDDHQRLRQVKIPVPSYAHSMRENTRPTTWDGHHSDDSDSDADNEDGSTPKFLPLTQAYDNEAHSDSSDGSNNSGNPSESENDEEDSSGGESGEQQNNENTPLMIRRQRNMRRNQGMLVELQLQTNSPQKALVDESAAGLSPTQPATPTPRMSQSQPVRGMLFATPYNNHPNGGKQAELLPGTTDLNEAGILRHLEQIYPYRQTQIRQLWSLLSPALTSSNTGARASRNIPAPIFVSGPTATGKSSVVRDVVLRWQQMRPPDAKYRVGTAYINCAVVEGTIDDIVDDAYQQFAHDMKRRRSLIHTDSHRKRKRKRSRKRTRSPKQQGIIANMVEEHRKETEGLAAADWEASAYRKIEGAKPKQHIVAKGKGCSANESKCHPDISVCSQTNSNKEPRNDEEGGWTERGVDKNCCEDSAQGIRRSRRLKENEEHDFDDQGTARAKDEKTDALKYDLGMDLTATQMAAAKDRDTSPSSTPATATTHTAVATFGDELQQTLFQDEEDCGILVLDQAERLLSLSSSPSGTSASKSNFLAQLLLLPRIKGLNLTIIVITKSILLEYSRFNNLVNPERSLTTLSSGIQPIHVHFQAYKGKETFKKILMQPMLLRRIVGPGMSSAFLASELEADDAFTRHVVLSFLNTLVQTLYGSIRDIKEFIRLGRSLWPHYVLPLHSYNLGKTLDNIQKRIPQSLTLSQQPKVLTKGCGKHLLSFLDQRILPYIKSKLENGLYSLTEENKVPLEWQHENPQPLVSISAAKRDEAGRSNGLQTTSYLSKCLMIAAFICQHNKAGKDKQLFTIQKNGKKNNGNKKKSQGEDLAFGTERSCGSKMFRPRLFPMERMLSVFISVVGLNQDLNVDEKPGQFQTRSQLQLNRVGSSDFMEILAHLRDMGVLHDKASGSGSSTSELLNLASPKFWCSLTRDEADSIAKSIGFSLADYLY